MSMGLTEVPCELFGLLTTSARTLWLFDNSLCSLPSSVAQLALLEELLVQCRALYVSHLTLQRCCQVHNNRLTCLPRELGLLSNLKKLFVRTHTHTHTLSYCYALRSAATS
jgi:Leucine-rich repeat (LRR) protein